MNIYVLLLFSDYIVVPMIYIHSIYNIYIVDN